MKTILVPVDFSDVTPAVIEAAKKMGKAFGSRIILLHVVEVNLPPVELVPGISAPGTIGVAVPVREDAKWEHRKMEEAKKHFAGSSLKVSTLVVEGEKLPTILAKSKNADLIVIGSHGHGALFHLLAGSLASGVLKSANIPVLVVPSPRK